MSGPTVHALLWDESGPAALRAVAAAARAGDLVVVFGPANWEDRLRLAGLSNDVEVRTLSSVGGSWWLGLRLGGALRLGLGSRARTDAMIAYGPRARVLLGAVAGEVVRQAGVAPQPGRSLSTGRRDRLRRSWGVARDEVLLHILSEPIEWLDPSFVVRAAGMAQVGGARLRLLASPSVPRIAEFSRWIVSTTGMSPCILVEEAADLARVVDAVDAVIFDQDGRWTDPVATSGARSAHPLDASIGLDQVSGGTPPWPIAEALCWGVPAIVHDSIDLAEACSGDPMKAPSGNAPLVFGSDVAELSRILSALVSRHRMGEVGASSTPSDRVVGMR